MSENSAKQNEYPAFAVGSEDCCQAKASLRYSEVQRFLRQMPQFRHDERLPDDFQELLARLDEAAPDSGRR